MLMKGREETVPGDGTAGQRSRLMAEQLLTSFSCRSERGSVNTEELSCRTSVPHNEASKNRDLLGCKSNHPPPQLTPYKINLFLLSNLSGWKTQGKYSSVLCFPFVQGMSVQQRAVTRAWGVVGLNEQIRGFNNYFTL